MPQAANLPEWYHEFCPECGIPWDEPSPECPKRIFNRHPLADIKKGTPMPDTPDRADDSMTRSKALALARQFVLEVYPPKDDSRFPVSTGDIREMLSQILTIAEFLSGEIAQVNDNTLAQIRDIVRSIDSHMP